MPSHEPISRGSTIPARLDTARVELARMLSTLAGLRRREGLGGASRAVGRVVIDQARYPWVVRRRAHETFRLLGQELPYTFTRYNNTFRNERSVEVSIARWFVERGAVGRMLEVGNVLAHYGIVGHDVVDRYETIRGVINEDIVDFAPTQLYDTVVSISTLEHVGQDETPSAPERAVTALRRLAELATPKGRIVVTVPIGHNPALDDAIRNRRVALPIETMLVRVDRENRWTEASLEEGLDRRYGSPFNNANAVYVGIRDESLLGPGPESEAYPPASA